MHTTHSRNTTETLATCPLCDVPNVIIIGGRISRHTEPGDQSDACECLASGMDLAETVAQIAQDAAEAEDSAPNTAENTYIETHAACVCEIESLATAIFDLPAPSEETDWADVGTAALVYAKLCEISDILAGRSR